MHCLMNDLYGNELYLLVNFFLQSFKLLNTQTMGYKIRKLHDKPKTPYQRLMGSEHIDKKDIGNRYIDKQIFSTFEMKIFSDSRVTFYYEARGITITMNT